MGYIAQWDQFTAQIEPIASTKPYMIGRFIIICINSSLSMQTYSDFSYVTSFKVFAVVTMSVTSQELDPFTRTWIQEENVVCQPRTCFMSPLRTGLISGMKLILRYKELCSNFLLYSPVIFTISHRCGSFSSYLRPVCSVIVLLGSQLHEISSNTARNSLKH